MNKNTRILFIINNLSKGGAEGVFINESKALSGLGYHCEIFLLYPRNFKNLYDIRGYARLISKIRREKIDVVYSTLDDANFVAKVTRLFCKFKLFCREANMTEDKPIKFKISDIILNFFVHKLVMVAEAVKDSYASYDPFHKHKMHVLHNGVEITPFLEEKTVNDPIKILAVGSFTNKKGFGDLVEIIKDHVPHKHLNFELNIVGAGHLFEETNLRIKKYGLESKIKCIGALEKEELSKYYDASHVFVLTSKKEGCPNVLLEAMSHGLCPVCFSVGAVPEIIEHGISGIVTAKGDREKFGAALTDLLKNKQKIKEIGKMARKRVEKEFSFDSHIKKLLDTLEI